MQSGFLSTWACSQVSMLRLSACSCRWYSAEPPDRSGGRVSTGDDMGPGVEGWLAGVQGTAEGETALAASFLGFSTAGDELTATGDDFVAAVKKPNGLSAPPAGLVVGALNPEKAEKGLGAAPCRDTEQNQNYVRKLNKCK